MLDGFVGAPERAEHAGDSQPGVEAVFADVHPAVPLDGILVQLAIFVNAPKVVLRLALALVEPHQHHHVLLGIVEPL